MSGHFFEEHTTWMIRARDVATRSLPQDVPVGAIIVGQDNQVISEGWNRREQDHDPAGHAEIMALSAAGLKLKNWRLNDCRIYVTLEPCPMCASALLQSRIGMVVYGAPDPIQGAMGSRLNLATLYPATTRVLSGIEEQACQEQLQHFFAQRR